MSEIQTQPAQPREALWTFPREWRVMYFGVFILLCFGFTVLGAVEYRGIGHWIESPFTSLTTIVIGSGTAAALISLFLTEIWRLIVTFSTWVEEKLQENLKRSRARHLQEEEERKRRRREVEERVIARARAQALAEGLAEGLAQGRVTGYEEGREAGLLEAQGKLPPPPRDENGNDSD